jgi:DNA primase
LREARDLARRCLLWFLNLAQLVIHACSTDLPDGIPKREEIMALIDLDPNAIDRMAKVIALAPHVFPAIKEWTR